MRDLRRSAVWTDRLPHSILIAGYFGFDNTGDEAILEAMIAHLRDAIPGVDITVVSGNPGHTAEACGAKAIGWRDTLGLNTVVQRSDLVIIGGGGLFHDYWGLDPDTALTSGHGGLSYLMTPALLSAIHGKRLMLYAVGVGPLLSEHGRQYTRVIASLAARITVRDAASQSLLESLGIPPEKITITADPAFDLAADAPADIPEVSEWLSHKFAIAVCLRHWNFGVDEGFWERQVAAALDSLLANEGGQALFVPLQHAAGHEDDVAVAERVLAQMRNRRQAAVLEQPAPPREIAGILAQADLVLGMRLHSLIFSLTAGVPFVALEYDPKVSLLAGMAGLQDLVLPLGGIDAGVLLQRMRQALAQPESLRIAASAHTAELRRCAVQNALIAADLLRQAPLPAQWTEDFRAVFSRVITAQLADNRDLVRRLDATIAESDALRQQWNTEREYLQHHRDSLQSQLESAQSRIAQLASELAVVIEAKGAAGAQAAADFATATAVIERLEQRIARLGSKSLAGIAKRVLQIMLDVVEICTPRRLRAALRKYYLNWFYFRLYPDQRPKDPPPNPVDAGPPPASASPRRTLHRTLDTAQRLVPEPVRKAVRPAYLRVYRRIFPRGVYEFSQPVLQLPPPRADAPPQATAPTPKVSVILPVWNHAALLGGAISSVLQQTYQNLELIVVDDGSAEDLLPIARQFAHDPRLHFVRRPHEGLPRTLSAGFRCASGDLFTWTSADNLMRPAMLATLVDFMLRRPDVQMTYGDMDLIDDQGAPLANSDYRVNAQRPGATHQLRLPRTVETLGLVNDNFIGGCFLYRSAVARAIGPFDDALLGTEDYDYWLRIQLLGRVEHVDCDECLYSYRVHQDSLSGRHSPQIVRNANELIVLHKHRTAFYRQPFQVVIAIKDSAESAGPELHTLARTLATAFQQDGHSVTITDAPEILPGKTLVICFSPALACELLARTTQPDAPFLFLRAPAPGCPIPRPELTWFLCGSRKLTAELPAGLTQHWSLCVPSAFSFEEQLMLNLKARDLSGQALVYIGPLDEALVDWKAVAALVSAYPDRPFLFASTSAEHDFDPRPLLPAGQIYYLGVRPWDEWYGLLLQAALLLAPFREVDGIEQHIYPTMTAYLAAAKPILATSAIRLAGFDDAPGTLIADDAAKAMSLHPDPAVADLYLRAHSPTAIAREIAGIANCRLFVSPRPRVSESPRLSCLLETRSLDTGGLERVVADLALSLHTAGIPTAIAVTGRAGRIADECRAAGIPVHVTGDDPAQFAEVLRSAHILIPHYSNLGAPLAWRAGIPVISFLHNAYVWMDATEDRAVRDTDLFTTHYIAVSQAVKSYFCRKYDVDPQKVTCIPNGVDLARLEEAAHRTPRVTRASLRLAADDYVFLNVATITGVKSQVHAVCAMRALAERCPRMRLIFLESHADPVYANEVAALVKEFGLAGRVLFCPSTDQVSDYYRLADAFLLPSLTEGWSLAMTEAMFFGLPLILTDVGGAAEVIEDGDTGILIPPACDPLDVTPANLHALSRTRTPPNLPALIAAMEDFYQRPEYWKAKGQSAAAKARARFDLTDVSARHLRAIRTLLAQHYDTN